MRQLSIDRRSLFKGTGALVVSIGIPGTFANAAPGAAVKPPVAPDQLDSWLAIKSNGDVVAYFGKMDMGQGVDVAIAQIVADELDVSFERVGVVMGDTAWTVNQGGASGSTGVQKGGIALRNTAAEARRVLIDMTSVRLGARPTGSRSRMASSRWRATRRAGRLRRVDWGPLFRSTVELERQNRQRAGR